MRRIRRRSWQRVGQRLREALQWGREQLRATATETPELDAEVLLRHVSGLTRAGLLAGLDRALTPEQNRYYAELVSRRARGEPVAYIVGMKEFFGIELCVDRSVLIPRPETEAVVERALACLPGDGGGRVVADVGTGSGAIALAISVNRVGAQVYATDTSEAALSMAKQNAERVAGAGWNRRLTFRHGALLAVVRGPVDVLCANLPYIPTDELAKLPASVRDYEPWSALDGGADGLDVYRALFESLPGRLNRSGVILMESDPRQAEALRALAIAALPGARCEILKDLAGDDRVVEVLT